MTLTPRRGKLNVPVEPMSDARWERIERRVLEARAGEAAPVPVASRRWVWIGGGLSVAVVAAAVVVMLLVARKPTVAIAPPVDEPVRIVAGNPPTRVVTPVGGTSRVEVGEATVTMSGDTAIEARVAADGAVVIELVRGKVACDVAPRPGRPPFSVVADDVTVAVVGTAFTVERGTEVRVEVTRGRVNVTRKAEETVALVAGDRWTSTAGRLAVAPQPTPTNVAAEPVAVASAEAAKKKHGKAFKPATMDDLAAAKKIEKSDPAAALRAYRIMMNDAPDAIAGEALVGVARLELEKNPTEAITAAKTYERRFPRGKDRSSIMRIMIQAYVRIDDMHNAHVVARRFQQMYPDDVNLLDGILSPPR